MRMFILSCIVMPVCGQLWPPFVSSIWLSCCLRAGRKVFSRGGYDCGSYSMIRENRDLPVTEWTAVSWVKSAMGRSSSHFCGCPSGFEFLVIVSISPSVCG